MRRPARLFPLVLGACLAWPFSDLAAAPAARTPAAHTAVASPPSDARDTDPNTGERRAEALRAAGNQAMLEMRYVDALASYQQAATLAPEYAGVLYSIARAHQLLGEFAEALKTLERFDREASPEVKAKVGGLDRLFAELRGRVGTLELSSNVNGARVLLRNKVLGITPLPLSRLEAGAATLELELDGFFPVRREIVVPAGGRLTLELALHARSSSALLTIRTSPGGAQIRVDGRSQGTSSPSVELTLPAGTHRITAQREGYDEASVPIVLRAGTSRDLALELERSVPVTSRWWFWTGAGLLVAGGVTLAIATFTERPAEKGTLTPGQISAPLRF
jgi:hypothetical protein